MKVIGIRSNQYEKIPADLIPQETTVTWLDLDLCSITRVLDCSPDLVILVLNSADFATRGFAILNELKTDVKTRLLQIVCLISDKTENGAPYMFQITDGISINNTLETDATVTEKPLPTDNRIELINKVLLDIANALRSSSGLPDLFKAIHKTLEQIIDSSNFYISLYEEDEDTLTFPYFADINDSDFPIPHASQTGSLTYEVVRTGQPGLLNGEQMAERCQQTGQTTVGTPSQSWLGVPLVLEGSTFGALVVQSYSDPLAFNQSDVEILQSVAGQVALVIERKRAEEQLIASLNEKQVLIDDLQSAVAKIKTLEGFIPICSACKNIRDDEGYWRQIEQYIQERSSAAFSHSICPDCMKRLYPNIIGNILTNDEKSKT